MAWFVKSKRAQTVDDDETWVEGGVCPTLNGFDSGDSRATVAIVAPTLSASNNPSRSPQSAEVTAQVEDVHAALNPPMSFTASEMSNSYAWEKPIYPTLTAKVPNDTSNLQQGVRVDSTVRRLTPVECERLQGFPDGWTAGQADSHRYKQMGNAVTTNVANYVAWLVNMTVGSDDECSI